MQNSEDNKAIVSNLQVTEDGLEDITTINLEELEKLGIKDTPAFLNGVLDAENEKDLNDSNEDYIKGYKYVKTGKL